MKQGSSRFGNDFETKVREFVAKYGYDTIAEDEVISCVEKGHKKGAHEVDLILAWTGKVGLPHTPLYGPQTGKFMVSCKGGVQLVQDDVDDASRQLFCVKNDPRFADVAACVIICQEAKPNLKVPSDVFVWDQKYVHLMLEKLRVTRQLVISKRGYLERQYPNIMLSNIFSANQVTTATDQKPSIQLKLDIFNENPKDSVGRTDIMLVIESIFDEVAGNPVSLEAVKGSIKVVSVYSATGIRADLFNLKGKLDMLDPTLYFPVLVDISLATWVPTLDEIS